MHCTLPRNPSRSASGHHLQAVAKDHAVRPVRRHAGRTPSSQPRSASPLKSAKRSICEFAPSAALLRSGAAGRRSAPWDEPSPGCRAAARHNQIGPVLFVLAAPDQLRVEIAVAALIGHADRAPARPSASRTGIRPWECSSARLLVRQRLDVFLRSSCLRLVLRHLTLPPRSSAPSR